MAHIEVIPQLLVFVGANPQIVEGCAQRIWGEKVPDKPGGGAWEYPQARFRDVTTDNQYHMKGLSARIVSIQIEVYDDQQGRADEITELFRDLFDTYNGMAGTLNIGRSTARVITREWNEERRCYWRVIAVEVKTNDK